MVYIQLSRHASHTYVLLGVGMGQFTSRETAAEYICRQLSYSKSKSKLSYITLWTDKGKDWKYISCPRTPYKTCRKELKEAIMDAVLNCKKSAHIHMRRFKEALNILLKVR